MAIQDVGKTPKALRAEPAPVSKAPENPKQTRKEQSERQQRTEKTQDKYVPADETVSPCALYKVSSVNRGRSIHKGKRFYVNPSAEGDKKITEKLVDMVLSQGKKKLEIFAEE